MSPVRPIAEPDWIALEGAVNVRDLGGMPARAGVTRKGMLLRGDNMSGLSEMDVARLAGEFGLKRLIDLRAPVEFEKSGPSQLSAFGVCVDHLPLIDDANLMRRRRLLRQAAQSSEGRLRGNAYHEYLDHGRASIAAAFEILAMPGGMPALVHCTAGRDRTGVLVAILLEAAGVDRNWIVADYAATASRAELLAARLAALSGVEQDAAAVTAVTLSTIEDTMEELLGYMDAKFGGARQWLISAGIGQDLMDRWQSAFVDPM